MRRVFAAFVVVLLLVPLTAPAAGVEGTYDCKGTNPGGQGSSYEGTVSIVKNGANYNVTWTIGPQVYAGVGILQGNQFSVGYSDIKQGWFGVVVYKVSGNTLSGAWAMHGDSRNGTETLTRK